MAKRSAQQGNEVMGVDEFRRRYGDGGGTGCRAVVLPRGYQVSSIHHNKARGAVREPGAMNKTEKRYRDEVLQPWLIDGTIMGYQFQPVTFTLAHKLEGTSSTKRTGMRYTPDWMYLHADRTLHFVDVKGVGRPPEEDALCKIKSAAEKFPFFFWHMSWPNSRERGDGWHDDDF